MSARAYREEFAAHGGAACLRVHLILVLVARRGGAVLPWVGACRDATIASVAKRAQAAQQHTNALRARTSITSASTTGPPLVRRATDSLAIMARDALRSTRLLLLRRQRRRRARLQATRAWDACARGRARIDGLLCSRRLHQVSEAQPSLGTGTVDQLTVLHLPAHNKERSSQANHCVMQTGKQRTPARRRYKCGCGGHTTPGALVRLLGRRHRVWPRLQHRRYHEGAHQLR
jgi:hypothetical protein